MLQILSLFAVVLLFLVGALGLRAAFLPGTGHDALSEMWATLILFAFAAASWSLAAYIIDSTLHWWL
jgi:hypothetical protein